MRSRLFECRVIHQRFSPVGHRFKYRVFMLAIDLDELPEIARRTRLLGINRGGFFSLRENDYLPTDKMAHNATTPAVPANDSSGLKQRVARFLESRGAGDGIAKIELITMPRIGGYRFNPVSFFFCYGSEGEPLAAIAEVTNTFGEVKPYVLDQTTWSDGAFRLRIPKHFYVSPFSDVDVSFDFRLRPAGGRLSVKIDDHEGDRRTLTSVLTGHSRPLSDRVLAWLAIKYPLLTLNVIFAIHWHALRLYLKKAKWFPKADRPDDQRDLFLPHRSLTETKQTRS